MQKINKEQIAQEIFARMKSLCPFKGKRNLILDKWLTKLRKRIPELLDKNLKDLSFSQLRIIKVELEKLSKKLEICKK